MKVATAIIVLLVIVFSIFAMLNWSAIAAPTRLSLGITAVEAPLGLVLLTGTGLLAALFLVFATYQQAAALLEARRFSRELRAERELADKAEASRFTDLRAYLEGALRSLDERSAAAAATADARLARVEQALTARLAEVENSLSAHVAEVEDKIERSLKR
jgi:uncharacterized integral membrane protein